MWTARQPWGVGQDGEVDAAGGVSCGTMGVATSDASLLIGER